MFKIALPMCFVFLSALSSPGAETWVKVKSPHFTVISNGSEKDAREVATGFEQIRASTHSKHDWGTLGISYDTIFCYV